MDRTRYRHTVLITGDVVVFGTDETRFDTAVRHAIDLVETDRWAKVSETPH